MRVHLTALSSIGLLSAALGGCLSGQTGSPDCVGPTACVCDRLYGAGTPLRVRVESASDGRLNAVVEERFASELGTSDLQVGERIGGVVDGAVPCAPEAPLDAPEGRELFVSFSPGFPHGSPNCSARFDCIDSRCASLDEPALSRCWESCGEQTRDSCEAARQAALLDGYYAWAIPWQDPLSFGAERELPLSDLSALSTSSRCLERFPADPAPPCQDTSTVTCAAVPRAPTAPAPGVGWLVLAAAVGALFRVRRLAGKTSHAGNNGGGADVAREPSAQPVSAQAR